MIRQLVLQVSADTVNKSTPRQLDGQGTEPVLSGGHRGRLFGVAGTGVFV